MGEAWVESHRSAQPVNELDLVIGTWGANSRLPLQYQTREKRPPRLTRNGHHADRGRDVARNGAQNL
jgi:hypothetical protein